MSICSLPWHKAQAFLPVRSATARGSSRTLPTAAPSSARPRVRCAPQTASGTMLTRRAGEAQDREQSCPRLNVFVFGVNSFPLLNVWKVWIATRASTQQNDRTSDVQPFCEHAPAPPAAVFGIPTADSGIPTADFGIQTADSGIPTADFGIRTAVWRRAHRGVGGGGGRRAHIFTTEKCAYLRSVHFLW